MYSVGLIGLGMSGMRFVRALNYLYKNGRTYQLEGVYDKGKSKIPEIEKLGANIYTNLNDFIRDDKYDVIIIAVNENAHYEILHKLRSKAKNCKKFIVEKPITETLHQSKRIAHLYEDKDVVVHYVERNSNIVTNIKNWITNNNLEVIRMNFLWGKFRLYDSRPTIGVISEITHPLDLLIYISDIPLRTEVKVVSGNYIRSDYSISGTKVLDSIDVTLLVNNKILMTGSSSFLWHTRKREITIFLRDKDSELVNYMVYMYFDYPRWDMDGYIIYKIESNGTRLEIENYKTDNESNTETICMTKTVKFLLDVAMELETNQLQKRLAHIKQSIFVQKIIDNIVKNSSDAVLTNVFNCNCITTENNDQRLISYLQAIDNDKYDDILDTGY